LLRAEQLHELEDEPVLFLGPRALYEIRVEHLLPSVEALHVGAPRERLCYLLPILPIVFGDGLAELEVFFFCPMPFEDVLIRSFLIFRGASLVQVRL
jgi:hypothetical protein